MVKPEGTDEALALGREVLSKLAKMPPAARLAMLAYVCGGLAECGAEDEAQLDAAYDAIWASADTKSVTPQTAQTRAKE